MNEMDLVFKSRLVRSSGTKNEYHTEASLYYVLFHYCVKA